MRAREEFELPAIGECYEHRSGRIAQVTGYVERFGRLLVRMRPVWCGQNDSCVSLRYLRNVKEFTRATHVEDALKQTNSGTPAKEERWDFLEK